MSTVLMVANQTLAGEAMTTFGKARMRTAHPEFTLLVPATATASVHPERSARLLGTIAGGVPRPDAVHEREDAADDERARSRLDLRHRVERKFKGPVTMIATA